MHLYLTYNTVSSTCVMCKQVVVWRTNRVCCIQQFIRVVEQQNTRNNYGCCSASNQKQTLAWYLEAVGLEKRLAKWECGGLFVCRVVYGHRHAHSIGACTGELYIVCINCQTALSWCGRWMPEMEVFSVQLPGSNNDVRLSNLEPKQNRYFMVKTAVHLFVHPCSTTRL